MSQILLIEDDATVLEAASTALHGDGHQVRPATSGAEGLKEVFASLPDLLVLELMLTDIDGFQILEITRKAGMEIPILLLSSRNEPSDRIMGFELGADQFLEKPFDIAEFRARVKALLVRKKNGEPGPREPVRFGSVEVDLERGAVYRRGKLVELTPKEYRLLEALIRLDGAVASRSKLLTEVWGYSAVVRTRTIDVHIAQLRKKLEDDPSSPRHILTVSKRGYRLVL